MAEALALALWEWGFAETAVFLLSNTAYVNAALVFAANSAYSSQQQRKARAAARSAYTASLKDRELMIRSAIAPRRYIFGRDKVSGPIVYAQSSGTKGEFLHIVVALAAHECDAIETVYFNDVALPDPDSSGFINSGEFARTISHTEVQTAGSGTTLTLAHTPTSVQAVTHQTIFSGEVDREITEAIAYTLAGDVVTLSAAVPGAWTVNYTWQDPVGTPRVRIRKYLGAAGQAADADLIDASGGRWTAQHRGAGICYLYVRLEFDPEIFGQIGLPNISAVLRGKKIADPRSGTTVWTDNAALCTANWLRSAEGMRATGAQVPDSEVVAAANIADESVPLTASTAQARYTYNGSFTSDQSPRDVLGDLLSSLAGHCVWTQGRWLLRAGAARTPNMTITADKLAGAGVSIVPKASRSELFNAVRVTYRDPSQGWSQVQAPLVTNATYEAQDGGVRIVRSITLPSAMDALRAQRLAKIELERERQALIVQLTGNLSTYDLAPTDTCYLTLDRYGFSDKLMEVRQRTWSPDGTLPYVLRETAAGVYAWNYGEATTVDLAPDTLLPSPYTAPAALTGLAAASGTAHLLRLGDGTIIARVLLTWAASTEAFVTGGGQIEAQWKRATDTTWQVCPPMPGDSTGTYLQPMPDQQVVLLRVRAINASGRTSAWAAITHAVLGKSAPPSNVSSLTATVVQSGVRFSWSANTEIDYSETDLRLGATWSSATPMFVGSSSNWTWLSPAAGSYTFTAKHRDTSGNYSIGTSSVTVVIDESMAVQWDSIKGSRKPADNASVGAALNTDPFCTSLSRWTGTPGLYTEVTLSDGAVGSSAFRASNGGGANLVSNYIAVDANKIYRVRFWVRKSAGADGTIYLAAVLSDSAGANITGDGSYWYYPVSGAAPGTTWQEYSGIFGAGQARTVPVNASKLAVGLFIHYQGTTGYHECQGVRLEDVTEAANAQAAAVAAAIAASNAQNSADGANAVLINIASDSLLTPNEKPAIILDRDVIVSERSGIDAQATAYGIITEKNAYDTAVTALTDYLATLTSAVSWDNTAGNTTISRGTFLGKFSDVFATRQALLNKIAQVAGTRATWAGIPAGFGKAADYATVNATFIQSVTPTALAAGDLWWHSGEGYKLYRATASGAGEWVAYQIDTAALSTTSATGRASQLGASNTFTGTLTTVHSCSIVTTGKEVTIWIGGTWSANGSLAMGSGGVILSVELWRDSTKLTDGTDLRISGVGGFYGQGPMPVPTFVDTPSAGTYTYYVKAKWTANGGSPYGVSASTLDTAIVLVEHKV